MSPYKPHKHCSNVEKNHNDKPVPIPLDVENKTIITNVIHRIIYLLNISHTVPIRVFYHVVPGIQGIGSIWVE